MKLLKIAGAALNQTPLDWPGNQARIVEAINAARKNKVALLCLPELCTSGYGCEDAFLGMGVVERAVAMVGEIARVSTGMVVSVGLPFFHLGALYNVAALLVDGRVAGLAAKQKLAGDGIHYEPRWFKPWPAGQRADVHFLDGGHSVPLGDIYFKVGDLRIAFEICEDAWAADRRGNDLADLSLDVILNPSASHFAFGKHPVRRRLVQEGSRAFAVSYVYCNLLGNEAGRVIYDGGVLIAHDGALVAQGPRLTFRDCELTDAVVDVESARMHKARLASFTPRVSDDPRRCVAVDFSWPEDERGDSSIDPPSGTAAAPSDWESSAHLKEEEFTRAVALGLFDYLRKSRSRGFIISLSGGADSAGVSLLCRIAIDLALRDLGGELFAERIGLTFGNASGLNAAEIARQLITCVYQSTAHSGPVTRGAAERVARAIGADYHHLDVEDLVQGYIARIERTLDRKLTWEHDDIALQNIQARVRSPGVWLLANLRGALLLSTSNRSEAAVGYATMDGDTSGGLSPIAGIDKAFLRSWLRWMETEGPAGLAPTPALSSVNAQQPTAELRPAGAGQTDETDLMPYPVLDAIEGEAIREKRTPIECWQRIRSMFPQHDAVTLRSWVIRFFQLWSRNQWKRERYAPCFHLDDKNLDPKTWCRYPILSGGFEAEIEALRKVSV